MLLVCSCLQVLWKVDLSCQLVLYPTFNDDDENRNTYSRLSLRVITPIDDDGNCVSHSDAPSLFGMQIKDLPFVEQGIPFDISVSKNSIVRVVQGIVRSRSVAAGGGVITDPLGKSDCADHGAALKCGIF